MAAIESNTVMNRTRVLVVDDEEWNIELLCDMLPAHCDASAARDGEDAVRAAVRETPDIVFLDVNMPGMDGCEACRRLRALPDGRRMKIIMVSARSRLHERLAGYDAGADDYVQKPYERAELLAKLNVYVRMRRMERELSDLNENLERQVDLRSRQLVEQERLAMIGRNSAGLIHNLKNPLAGVLGYAELVAEQYPDNPRPKKMLLAAREMRDIIGSVLDAVRGRDETRVEAVDVNDILSAALDLLRVNRFFRCRVESDIDLGDVPPVEGVRHHFSQVANNILGNALDAMHDAPERRLGVKTRVDGADVRIDVSDTGCGMTREQAERVFDPFYTTKPLVRDGDGPVGTGLGLHMCGRIVESYGGDIDFESEPGVGTTVRVRLPAAKTVPTARHAPA